MSVVSAIAVGRVQKSGTTATKSEPSLRKVHGKEIPFPGMVIRDVVEENYI